MCRISRGGVDGADTKGLLVWLEIVVDGELLVGFLDVLLDVVSLGANFIRLESAVPMTLLVLVSL